MLRLRVKVTNKCNLNCIFCHREGSNESRDLLTVSDYEFIGKTCASIGIRRFKISGGEPLLREDIVEIVRALSPVSEDISITTNGVLLDRYVDSLRSAGLNRLNVSVHTLDRRKYRYITGRDLLEKVLDNVLTASKAGFRQVKINAVVTRLNYEDIPSLIRFCREHGLSLQLIELMPIGIGRALFESLHVPLLDVMHKLVSKARGLRIREDLHNRPVLYIDDVAIELVMGVNNVEFCRGCRQIRLTSDGKLRGCIYRPFEIDVLDLVKRRDSEGLLSAIREIRKMWTPMWR